MASPSSTFKPKLTDQEYMELVFENGQILAKSQRSTDFSVQNQRTLSIMDLYEAEYNEDFMKSIHGDTSDDTQILEASKRMVVDYENRKDIEFIPPDEQSVVAERSVEPGFDSTDFTEDSVGSTYLSSSLDDVRPRVPARTRKAMVKRRRSNEPYNSPERASISSKQKQANGIDKKMRTLQDLVPNSHKDDKESLLDEAINYMTTLQLQVQMMTMGNRFVTPAMMLPFYSQMGLATGVQMGVPQFLTAPVLGAGLPGNSYSADMRRFLDHPGLMPLQNSALNYFPQSGPPSCAAFPNQIPNSTSLSNLDDARTDGGILSGKRSDKP